MRFVEEVLSCDAPGCTKRETQHVLEESSWLVVEKRDLSIHRFIPMAGPQEAFYACGPEHAKLIIEQESAEISRLVNERIEELEGWNAA